MGSFRVRFRTKFRVRSRDMLIFRVRISIMFSVWANTRNRARVNG